MLERHRQKKKKLEKISPIWDWRSTPTLLTAKSRDTKTGTKIKNLAPISFIYCALI